VRYKLLGIDLMDEVSKKLGGNIKLFSEIAK